MASGSGTSSFSAQSNLPAGDFRFSILIPTWNNLPYLKLCLESLVSHSGWHHEIILHINDGSDGTLEWAQQQDLKFTHSPENIGICHALNRASELATTGYIAYFNDDMFALPGWDVELAREIACLPHDNWFLSSTMIEPRETGNACALAPYHFGTSLEDFDRERLLKKYSQLPFGDWNGATWPPNVVPKKWWEAVGGYSPEFSPGMSSDPDFSMKLWQKGIRHFKGIGSSRVYHFMARSTGKVVKNDGNRQFLQKYGITQSTFFKYYLRRGQPWTGPLGEPEKSAGHFFSKLKSKLKKLRG